MAQTAIILAHGGAGSPNAHSDGPEQACRAGAAHLEDREPDRALRAALEAAVHLEDDPRFNAGTGSNLRLDGSLEMDAILASGDGRIGSVAAISEVSNPVRVARLVMDSPHVMLSGAGAVRFAAERGLGTANPITREARERHSRALERLRTGDLARGEAKWSGWHRHGTIGVAVRDRDGRFAVASSTGGTSLMLPGRTGDTPIFGAGVMCGPLGAVCATGDGEEILRRLASHRVYARIARGEHPQIAVETEVSRFPEPWVVGFIAIGTNGYGSAATGDVMARAALEL
jgi:isoaspartyl peptidase/L-asparaginase-like protein (Ntn-hydrolase superfamily)